MHKPGWAITFAAIACVTHGIDAEDAANRLAFAVDAIGGAG